VYEVDGSVEDSFAAVYCANLMLLSELFIDHKTMVVCANTLPSSLRFYILTVQDEFGATHFVGCFFKVSGKEISSLVFSIVNLLWHVNRVFV